MFDKYEELSKLHDTCVLDKDTKNMLWENIFNVYSDAEQLEIIQYLVELLKGSNELCADENSIEEVYVKGLEKVLKDIQDLKVKEHDFLLDN